MRRGPRRGLTAEAIATRGDLNLNTTRSTLTQLQAAGSITVVGTFNGGFGRPANLYAYTA